MPIAHSSPRFLGSAALPLAFSRLIIRILSSTEEKFRPSLKVILESIFKPKSDIVIYGAGFLGQKIYQAVQTHGKHKIKFWCDQNAANLDNPLVSHPEILKTNDFDAVIIAIANPAIVKEVREYLLKLGIEERKMYQL